MTVRQPVLSIVMPCYNEERSIQHTIPRLVSAFRKAGHAVEVIAVDNGSTDGTAKEILRLSETYPEIRLCRVEKNQGYGHGILSGFPEATAPWVGMIPADGQVDEEDVVRLFETVHGAGGALLGKVRRRFRMDGLNRKVVSIAYNLMVRVLWPTLGTLDVNGNPKIFPRSLLPHLDLDSRGWLLDPELMLKCHHLGVRVLELNVFARVRGAGLSNVSFGTGWEFFRALLFFRFGGLAQWKRAHPSLDFDRVDETLT
jgi:glycosyltransferase involved in cell wall biosynthesis